MDPDGSAEARPAAEKVASLFGELEALELAMARAEQALLDALDDPDSASVMGELREHHDTLGEAVAEVVRQIREHVDNSSALAVFAGQDQSVRALAGAAGKPPAGTSR